MVYYLLVLGAGIIVFFFTSSGYGAGLIVSLIAALVGSVVAAVVLREPGVQHNLWGENYTDEASDDSGDDDD